MMRYDTTQRVKIKVACTKTGGQRRTINTYAQKQESRADARKPRDAACYLPHPHSISTWNFVMIPLEQIGASLPHDSEDHRIILIFFITSSLHTDANIRVHEKLILAVYGNAGMCRPTGLVPFHQSCRWSLMALAADRLYDRRRFCCSVADLPRTLYDANRPPTTFWSVISQNDLKIDRYNNALIHFGCP